MKQTVIVALTAADIEKILREYIFEETGRTVSTDKAVFSFEAHAADSGRGPVTSVCCKITFTPFDPKSDKPPKRPSKKW